MGKRLEINKGNRYNMLTVISEVELHITLGGNRIRKFLFQCDCGNTKEIVLNDVRTNKTMSCGCHKQRKGLNQTHGLSDHYLYATWRMMKQRCYNPKNKDYYRYGGRGIKVCDRWLNSFPNFLEDMGERPEGYSIERKNKDGNYTPDNCKWADDTEQNENRHPWGTHLKHKKNPNQTQLILD